jgi:hypothetical protein
VHEEYKFFISRVARVNKTSKAGPSREIKVESEESDSVNWDELIPDRGIVSVELCSRVCRKQSLNVLMHYFT